MSAAFARCAGGRDALLGAREHSKLLELHDGQSACLNRTPALPGDTTCRPGARCQW